MTSSNDLTLETQGKQFIKIFLTWMSKCVIK